MQLQLHLQQNLRRNNAALQN